jgi:hypothetical protein
VRKLLLIAAIALPLAGCGHLFKKPEPTVVTKTVYVPVEISPELLTDKACPAWPKKKDYVITGTDSETSDYMLKGYGGYTCEHDTRMKIREQNDRSKKDIEARNNAPAK